MMRHLPIGGGFLLASALLHAVGLASIYSYFDANFDIEKVEEVSQRISLGLSASQAGSVSQPTTEPVEPIREKAEPQKPKPVPREAINAPAPKQVREPEETPPPEQEAPPPEETEVEARPPAPSPSVAPIEGNEGVEGSNKTPVQQAETSNASEAGAQQLEARYDLLVLRLLKKEKHYPALAKRRRHEGTVRLTFTINKAGALIRQDDICAESHWPELSRSAIQQLARAAPFPTPPENVRWETRTYNVDIHFSLEDESV